MGDRGLSTAKPGYIPLQSQVSVYQYMDRVNTVQFSREISTMHKKLSEQSTDKTETAAMTGLSNSSAVLQFADLLLNLRFAISCGTNSSHAGSSSVQGGVHCTLIFLHIWQSAAVALCMGGLNCIAPICEWWRKTITHCSNVAAQSVDAICGAAFLHCLCVLAQKMDVSDNADKRATVTCSACCQMLHNRT